MKISELLPIGSVVLLEGAKKRMMITGIKQTVTSRSDDGGNAAEETYDYVGVLYPEGFIGTDKMFLFDHSAIDEVYFRGYEDFERKMLFSGIEEAMPEDGGSSSDGEKTE